MARAWREPAEPTSGEHPDHVPDFARRQSSGACDESVETTDALLSRPWHWSQIPLRVEVG